LKRIRTALQVTENNWPDERLHRLTDELAVVVGFRVRLTPKLPMRNRIAQIRKRFIKPALALASTLADKDFVKEFYLSPKPIVLNHFNKRLLKIIRHIESHVKALGQQVQRGQSWDSTLKIFHVDVVSMLCEFINNDFEPSRNVQDNVEQSKGFRDVVHILGSALFERNDNDEHVSFDGAIRSLVDRWNRGKRAMMNG
jgi:hypothetical protein